MYTHRNVEDSDLVVICSFPKNKYELFNIHPSAAYPLTVEQLRNTVDSRDDSTVILCDHQVVAFANFYVVQQGDTCSIGNVIVAPDARGNGVGKFLIRMMIAIAKEKHKVKDVRISCFSNNAAGLLLYTQLGFKPDFIDKVNDPDDNIVARINFKLLL